MREILETWQFAALIVFIYMTVWFLIALIRRRNDLADVAWGPGFILVSMAMQFMNGQKHPRAYLISTLVLLWGLRLSLHIYTRNRGKPEDFRYRQWRQEWGRWFMPRTYLQVFLLQGILMLLIAAPIVAVQSGAGANLNWLDLLGAIVWGAGFYFEAVGDYQLRQHTRNPSNRGKIMKSGLWKFTRHPNYFGEVALWWGIFLIALSAPNGWVVLIGPVTITFLLLQVSGIPMLEKKYEGNPEFEEYKKRTSAFFPLPPKAHAGD